MTATELRINVDYRINRGYFSDYAAYYDIDAIDREILGQMNALLPDGVDMLSNGQVIVQLPTGRLDDPALTAAAEIDFDELRESIDYDAIVTRYELPKA